MSSKFDTCIYAEYFGDYGMRICNDPKRKDHCIYSDDCRKCKNHTTQSVAKPCPFCGNKVHISNCCGRWEIHCGRCAVEMEDKSIDDLIERWNKRT